MKTNVMRGMVTVTASVADAGSSAPCVDFVASTDMIDRYGEVVEPSGWRLERYRANPVFLNSHRHGDVTAVLGKALLTEVRSFGDRQALVQRVEFATEVSPQARIAYGLYRGGFLKAVSVGFIALKWEDSAPGEERPYSRRYLEQELVEVSAVSVPANSEALALGVRSGLVDERDVYEVLKCTTKGLAQLAAMMKELC